MLFDLEALELEGQKSVLAGLAIGNNNQYSLGDILMTFYFSLKLCINE